METWTSMGPESFALGSGVIALSAVPPPSLPLPPGLARNPHTKWHKTAQRQVKGRTTGPNADKVMASAELGQLWKVDWTWLVCGVTTPSASCESDGGPG